MLRKTMDSFADDLLGGDNFWRSPYLLRSKSIENGARFTITENKTGAKYVDVCSLGNSLYSIRFHNGGDTILSSTNVYYENVLPLFNGFTGFDIKKEE